MINPRPPPISNPMMTMHGYHGSAHSRGTNSFVRYDKAHGMGWVRMGWDGMGYEHMSDVVRSEAGRAVACHACHVRMPERSYVSCDKPCLSMHACHITDPHPRFMPTSSYESMRDAYPTRVQHSSPLPFTDTTSFTATHAHACMSSTCRYLLIILVPIPVHPTVVSMRLLSPHAQWPRMYCCMCSVFVHISS